MFDPAQICLNGHVIVSDRYERHLASDFCQECGASTIAACPSCNQLIRGLSSNRNLAAPDIYNRPNFCPDCGAAYPWTKVALETAGEYADELETLTDDEKTTLKENLALVVKDTPQTPLAASRVKKILARAGVEGGAMLREIVVDVVSETAKKLIWPGL